MGYRAFLLGILTSTSLCVTATPPKEPIECKCPDCKCTAESHCGCWTNPVTASSDNDGGSCGGGRCLIPPASEKSKSE